MYAVTIPHLSLLSNIHSIISHGFLTSQTAPKSFFLSVSHLTPSSTVCPVEGENNPPCNGPSPSTSLFPAYILWSPPLPSQLSPLSLLLIPSSLLPEPFSFTFSLTRKSCVVMPAASDAGHHSIVLMLPSSYPRFICLDVIFW